MADFITGSRIVISLMMLFTDAFSPAFYACYIMAGFTDMIDGTIARLMKQDSEFGARLDTVADMVFVVASIIKIFPAITLPPVFIFWIIIIAVIKVISMVLFFQKSHTMISVHSVLNKSAGGVLFLLPLTIEFLDIRISLIIVCLLATVAAIHELLIVRRGNSY